MSRVSILVLLLLPFSAGAQGPLDSIVRVQLASHGDPATHVLVRDAQGIVGEIPVPDPCADPCIVRQWMTLPDGDIWANSVNSAGESPASNVVPGQEFSTLRERADVNMDDAINIIDLLLVNRMIFNSP